MGNRRLVDLIVKETAIAIFIVVKSFDEIAVIVWRGGLIIGEIAATILEGRHETVLTLLD